MAITSVVISSGHGLYVRGASGILDEVDEARRVVEQVASELRQRGIKVITFHDDVSTTQSENLDRIVDFHNSQTRDADVSIHFNAYEQTSAPRGTEVLYVTQKDVAAQVSAAIASVGFIDRGAKYNDGLAFLNGTDMPAILVEVCFVDSEADAELYRAQFRAICDAMAAVVGDEELQTQPPPSKPLFYAKGKCSHFGGPADDGVAPGEGLAFIDDYMDMPPLFLPYQPAGTTGLARRLNPHVHYIACRWDYARTPKSSLLDHKALVRSVSNPDRALTAFAADWGPNENTGRVADLSPSLLYDLGLTTDDEVEVIYPHEDDGDD